MDSSWSKAACAVTSLLALACLAYGHEASQPVSRPPDLDIARERAPQIFNAVHSAMRQWGASVHHNGMSFFLATVPEGNVFYHGGLDKGPLPHFDWLAFEPEHSYMFARSSQPKLGKQPRPKPDPDKPGERAVFDQLQKPGRSADALEWMEYQAYLRHRGWHGLADPTSAAPTGSADQHPLATTSENAPGPAKNDSNWNPIPAPRRQRGYFQSYRTTRPLKVLYIDGQAAAKASFGLLDSTDIILLNETRDPWDDIKRGGALCDLVSSWGLDGIIRTEAGFEIINCDFGERGGVELLFSNPTPYQNETDRILEGGKVMQFEWIRAVSRRNWGLPAGRVDVDWASMVTAFAYEGNLTNPDVRRRHLPRAMGLSDEQKTAVRNRITDVVARRRDGPPHVAVNWQTVTDGVVARFSERIEFFAHANLSRWGQTPFMQALAEEHAILTNPYLSYPLAGNETAVGIELCKEQHLGGPRKHSGGFTAEDVVIFVAIAEVVDTVCNALFAFRPILNMVPVSRNATAEEEVIVTEKVRTWAQDLMETLQWSTWKECSGCTRSDQVCYIPMFPVGEQSVYDEPRCQPTDGQWSAAYWFEPGELPP
jgi:hypothetical protein